MKKSADVLNKWANIWKMFLNPGPSKPAPEVLFSFKEKEK